MTGHCTPSNLLGTDEVNVEATDDEVEQLKTLGLLRTDMDCWADRKSGSITRSCAFKLSEPSVSPVVMFVVAF